MNKYNYNGFEHPEFDYPMALPKGEKLPLHKRFGEWIETFAGTVIITGLFIMIFCWIARG